MSTLPPAAPHPPQKPIRSAKWGLILAVAIFGLFVLLDLATSIHLSHKPTKAATLQQSAAGASVARSFDGDTQQLLSNLEKSKAALQAAVDKAHGVDLSRVTTPIPDCNQVERDKLQGKYFITATSDGIPVRLACLAENDEWAVIPQASASIEPLTPQQQAALQQQPIYGTQQNAGQSAAEQRKQAREKAREEALNSSSVALDFMPVKGAAQPVSSTPTTQTVPSNEGEKQGTDVKPKYPWDQYSGPLYRVFEGSVIETVLTNRLNGEFTGPVNVMVSTNLYSHDHQHILMPQGTRILGEAMKVTVQNQRRLAVVFHRASMPDGYSVDFDKFAGLDQQGATGLTGKVNTHWAKVIGTAILVGAIGGLSEFGSFSGATGPGVVLETGIGAQTGQQATQILDRALNVLPSVTVFEGTRVRIWSARDFTLPAYENHAVNPAL